MYVYMYGSLCVHNYVCVVTCVYTRLCMQDVVVMYVWFDMQQYIVCDHEYKLVIFSLIYINTHLHILFVSYCSVGLCFMYVYASYLSFGLFTPVRGCENDVDADGDGLCGDADTCPYDTSNDVDSDLICGNMDSCPLSALNDVDNDGLCENGDGCIHDAENDADSDNLCADADTCPYDTNNDQDSDSICGDIDSCPVDSLNDADGDGACDNTDSGM